jgi:hypothetical protein
MVKVAKSVGLSTDDFFQINDNICYNLSVPQRLEAKTP